jgi:hypothetical protein
VPDCPAHGRTDQAAELLDPVFGEEAEDGGDAGAEEEPDDEPEDEPAEAVAAAPDAGLLEPEALDELGAARLSLR